MAERKTVKGCSVLFATIRVFPSLLARFHRAVSTRSPAFAKIRKSVVGNRVPPLARGILDVLARQYHVIAAEIGSIDKSIPAWHRSCEASLRLAEIPGIRPIVARSTGRKEFGSGRSLAAWIGLVPKQHTTGGKDRLGSITKQDNRYLRRLLVVGAMAVIRYAQKHGDEEQAVAWPIDGSPTHEGGRGRACQQDGANGLGHHGPWRQI